MKSLIQFVVVSIICAFLFASCQKCHTCVAKDQDGVKRYTYPEMCGNKKDLSAYADKCETEYGKFGYTCECAEGE